MKLDEAYERIKNAYKRYYLRKGKQHSSDQVETYVGEQLALITQISGKEWDEYTAKRLVLQCEAALRN